MRTALSAVVACVVWLSAPGCAGAVSPQDLLRSCRAVIETLDGKDGATVDIPVVGLPCWYFMSAMQSMSVLVDQNGEHVLGICAPADSTVVDFVRAFMRFARDSNIKSEANPAAAALLGLANAYPCGHPADK